MGNAQWRANRLAELAAGSKLAETSLGPIEFVQSGKPPFVMQLHGTPGGYDQCMLLGAPFLAAGMGSIGVSRPGYLRTPLSVGDSPAQQADALAALLDALQLERVAVQGVSGGGPASIHFAARHADRISVLFLTCAVAAAYPIAVPAWSKWLMTARGMRLSEWLLEKFPQATVKQLIREESTYGADEVKALTRRVMADPGLLEFVQMLTRSSNPWEDRQMGFHRDIEAIRALAKAPLPLESVRCPTLIVHGTADDDVPFTVAVEAQQRIPNAELHSMENACHLLWVDAGVVQMQQRQVEFLRAHG